MFRFSLLRANEVDSAFGALSVRVGDFSWFWQGELEDLIAELQGEHFDSEGQGSWPELSDAYEARKARTHPGQPIEVRDGALRETMTRPRTAEAGGIWIEAPNYLEAGSSLAYAVTQHEGDTDRNLPARPLWSSELIEGTRVALLYRNQLTEFAQSQGFPVL